MRGVSFLAMSFHCMAEGSAPALLPALPLSVTLSGEKSCSLFWKRGSSLRAKPSAAPARFAAGQ